MRLEFELESERIFKQELKRLDIKFLKDNVFTIGDVKVPIYVKFVASLGPKFSFVPGKTENGCITESMWFTMSRIQDQINDCISEKTFKRLCKDKFWMKEQQSNITRQQRFIRNQFDKSKKFLKANPQIVITSVDKGGKIVITTKEIYLGKMDLFVQKCVNDRIFFPVNRDFKEIRAYVEDTFTELRRMINPHLANDISNNYNNCCYQLVFEPFVIARLYGTFKLHKSGTPMRPIISTVDGAGDKLGNWLLRKLELITAKISKYIQREEWDGFFQENK